MSERREAIEVARGLLRRKRRGSDIFAESEAPGGKAAVDWREIPELRVLRSSEALYEEFVRRKEAGEPKEIAALLYAAMKFPDHPQAVEMINCCAYNRLVCARSSQHLVQAHRGFTLAMRLVAGGEQQWRVAINRIALLNQMGLAKVSLRDAGMLLPVIPPDHPFYLPLCSNMGEAYTCLGRNDLAALAYERALSAEELRPGDRHEQRVGLARAYLRLGREEEARRLLIELGTALPGHRLLLEAEILVTHGDWRGCVDKGRLALRAFPIQAPWSMDRKVVAEAHRLLFVALSQLGDPGTANKHRQISRVLGTAFALSGFDQLPSAAGSNEGR